MALKGEWIANCLPDRVDRIAAASVYHLQIGDPRPNQLQTFEDLKEQGLVGLYRTERKSKHQVKHDQAGYLSGSDFSPTPGLLAAFSGLTVERGGNS